MDAFYLSSGVRVPCDTYNLTLTDISNWSSYKNKNDYVLDNAYIWGDGTVITEWKDKAWSDFYIRGAFQKWTGSAWVNIVLTTGTGWNGSHNDVSQASTWRVSVWSNLSFYGIANQTVRVCAAPIYNYLQAGNWVCTDPFTYGTY